MYSFNKNIVILHCFILSSEIIANILDIFNGSEISI